MGTAPYSISEWSNLLSVQAEAAATLTGLVFVAVSINLTRVMAYPTLPGRAGESILQFLTIFLYPPLPSSPDKPLLHWRSRFSQLAEPHGCCISFCTFAT